MALGYNTRPTQAKFIPFNTDLYTKMRVAQEAPALGNISQYGKMKEMGYNENKQAQADADRAMNIFSGVKAHGIDQNIELENIKKGYYSELEEASKKGNLRSRASSLAQLRRRAEADLMGGNLFNINKTYQTAQEDMNDANARLGKGDIDELAARQQIEQAGTGFRAQKSKDLSDLDKLLSEGYSTYRPDLNEEDIESTFTNIAYSEMANEIDAAKNYWGGPEASDADKIKLSRFMGGIKSVIDQNIYKYRETAADRKNASDTNGPGYESRYMSNLNVVKDNTENIELNKTKNYWFNKYSSTILSGIDPFFGEVYDSFVNKKNKQAFIDDNKDLVERIKKENNFKSDDEAYDALTQELKAFDLVRHSEYSFMSPDSKKNVVAFANNNGIISGYDEKGNAKELDLTKDKDSNKQHSDDNLKINVAKGTINFNVNGKYIDIGPESMDSRASAYANIGREVMSNLVNTKKDGSYLVGVDKTGKPINLDLSEASTKEAKAAILGALHATPFDYNRRKSVFLTVPSEGTLEKKIQKFVLVRGEKADGSDDSYAIDTSGGGQYMNTGQFNDYILDGYNSVYNFKN